MSTEAEFTSILDEMSTGYHGWKLDTGGIFVEEFINGREFTTLGRGIIHQSGSNSFLSTGGACLPFIIA
ncbi:MAG: hypothetical protein WDN75_17505 [Bacteroidota bacterium]